MKRRSVVKAALAGAGVLAAPAYLRAQSSKKLSVLTWNIADQEELFKTQFADFKAANPGVEIEWLDKKGPDLPAFYQTQIVAGTPPDIVDLQGAIWVDYAANGGLVDLTPYSSCQAKRSPVARNCLAVRQQDCLHARNPARTTQRTQSPQSMHRPARSAASVLSVQS